MYKKWEEILESLISQQGKSVPGMVEPVCMGHNSITKTMHSNVINLPGSLPLLCIIWE